MTEHEVVERLRRAGCVFAEDEAALLVAHARTDDGLESLLVRREHGEPLEHLLGWVEVAGIRAAVDPGVFVPRQRSRVLVRAAVELLESRAIGTRGDLLEICCGSAALAAAVLRSVPTAEVWASDIDERALASARRNLGPERVVRSDLLADCPPVLRGRIDVLLANAPYVPTDDLATMPREAREHEPALALDGGADGVDVHRRIAAQAGPWLSATGAVVVETSRRQAALTASAFEGAGLTPTIVRDDDVDGTCVVARRG